MPLQKRRRPIGNTPPSSLSLKPTRLAPAVTQRRLSLVGAVPGSGVDRQAPPAVVELVLRMSIWLAIFIPGHMYNWLVERLFVGLITILALGTALLPGSRRHLGLPVSFLASIFFSLTAINALAYAVHLLRFQAPTGVRDYIEGGRYIIYLSFVYLIATGFGSRTVKTLRRAVLASLAIGFLAFAARRVRIPVISWVFNDVLYAGSKTIIFGSYIRLSVPFENPNYLAFYLLLVLAYFGLVTECRVRYLVLLGAPVLCFFTGARFGWGAAAIVFFFLLIASISDVATGRSFKSASVVILLAVVGCVFVPRNWDFIAHSDRAASVGAAVHSGRLLAEPNLAARLEMAQRGLQNFATSPLIGIGSWKYSVIEVLDNQYSTWLLRVGVVGFAMMALALTWAARLQYRAAVQCHHGRLGVLAFWLSAMAMLATGSFLDNFRLFFLFWVFLSAIDFELNARKGIRGQLRGATSE